MSARCACCAYCTTVHVGNPTGTYIYPTGTVLLYVCATDALRAAAPSCHRPHRGCCFKGARPIVILAALRPAAAAAATAVLCAVTWPSYCCCCCLAASPPCPPSAEGVTWQVMPGFTTTMLPPSSKRKWWERDRVHTYPTFDNKLNCAIELYYTHRDDGNLAAPEHRSQDPWRHPMGPLEHWPSGLVEQLLGRKPPAYLPALWRNHAAAGYPRAPRPLGSRHVKYAGGLALAALFVTNCGGTTPPTAGTTW